MIRLCIIEDHVTLIVSSFRFLFRPNRDGIMVNAFATSVEEAIETANPEAIDLFILDLYIPETNPIENIRKLKSHFPGIPVAIFSNEKSSSWKAKMMQEGALTYITKDSSRLEIKKSIQKAAAGEVYYAGKFDITEAINPEVKSLSEPVYLSPVQKEIVRLLSNGLTHKEISNETSLSRSMIEKILNTLKANLKVKNNLELINLLSKKGNI